LRLKPGHEIILFDEGGIEHIGRIEEVNTKEIKILIMESRQVETESKLKINLLQGIPKGNKMDLIVEKATELGVKNIVPVITERSQVGQTQKIKRWQRIAVESSKQCGRVIPPTIHEVVDFQKAIEYSYYGKLNIILYEKCKDSIKSIINNDTQYYDNIIFFVGPEGGFSENEIRLAQDKGFIPIGLGPRILRTETASIVAISILQFMYGDI
jgi:16S rRNA (uracil1498-N3)-methyltransferase